MPRHKKIMLLLTLILGASLLLSESAPAQYNLSTVNIQQPQNTLNTETTGAADTAVTTSIAATAQQRVHLYSAVARCSAGTATLTIKNGVAGTTVRSFAAAASHSHILTVPISSSVGNGMDVVLGTCGGANTGTLSVHASKF